MPARRTRDRPSYHRLGLPLAIAIFWAAPPAHASAIGVQAAVQTESLQALDSAELHLLARQRQRGLEELRVAHADPVPRYYRCWERVGRSCLSYVPEAVMGHREPGEVVVARDSLLSLLDSASAILPGDGWLANQRVRYLIEAGRLDDARGIIEACPWRREGWCDALRAHLLQLEGRFARADSAFRAALARMPEERARRWLDIAPFLDGETRRVYGRASSEVRDSLERRFWWLADPLYLRPPNDRWTEHLSRRTQCDLLADSWSGFGPWGPDVCELVLRHGWPIGWGRSPVHATVIAFYAPHRVRVLPPSRYLAEPESMRPGDWPLIQRVPPTTYAASYLDRFGPLEYQVATFLRGDSAVLVAAYDQREDTAWWGVGVDAALFAQTSEREEPVVVRRRGPAVGGVLSLVLEARPALVSLELLAEPDRMAARERFWLPLAPKPPLVLAVSDLLVMRDIQPLPGSLWRAVPAARGSLRVKSGERLGVFWELYGLGSDAETIHLSLVLHPVKESVYRDLRRVVLEGDPPLAVRWREQVPARQHLWARSIAIDLPPDLTDGTYLLRLIVTTRGREPVQTGRILLVEN